MSERIVERMGIPAVVVIALLSVVAYSVWGAYVLRAQELSTSQPQAQVAIGEGNSF